jgi:hypothetical protein
MLAEPTVWDGNQSTEMAIDDVSGGHTFMPSDRTDLGLLGLADSINDWILLPAVK